MSALKNNKCKVVKIYFIKILVACSLWLLAGHLFAAESSKAAEEQPLPLVLDAPRLGVSSNPGAVNVTTGSGDAQNFFQKQLGIQNDHGIRLGGLWASDVNALMAGGAEPGTWSLNSLLILDLNINTEKIFHWKGGSFGAEFLQFNGSNTNGQAGSIQGYNSLPGPNPLNRSQLYELWYRQEVLDGKLVFRVGKTIPTFDFGNVLRPIPEKEDYLAIPAVSGLIYTPIFINPALYGVEPGYYNSAYGLTINVAPIKEWYFSYGVYDGNLARGKQTGLAVLPEFNSYYFNIGETGVNWHAGKDRKPGMVAGGFWYQTGKLQGAPGISENGTYGFYFFGSQRLWFQHPHKNNSGISAFFQLGGNTSITLPIFRYIGLGLTGFDLVPHRPLDSWGLGMSLSWLNPTLFVPSTELMFQAYYQAHVVAGLYLQPTLSYIPNPGAAPNLPGAWASTLRMVFLF